MAVKWPEYHYHMPVKTQLHKVVKPEFCLQSYDTLHTYTAHMEKILKYLTLLVETA